MSTLSEILDVEFPLPGSSNTSSTLPAVIPSGPDVSQSANNTVEDDAIEARSNVRKLIAQGTTAVSELLVIARDLKTPRAYEVASNMLKTLSELSHDLMIVHQQEQSLIPEVPPTTGNVHIETAVFIGSTADLGELVKRRRAEKDANTITVEAQTITDTIVQAETCQPEILPQESTP